jgi:hypothetical protein
VCPVLFLEGAAEWHTIRHTDFGKLMSDCDHSETVYTVLTSRRRGERRGGVGT